MWTPDKAFGVTPLRKCEHPSFDVIYAAPQISFLFLFRSRHLFPICVMRSNRSREESDG
jgi:hypothetical protein